MERRTTRPPTARALRGPVVLALLVVLASCAAPVRREVPSPPPPEPALREFEATAYSVEGKTASGTRAHEGTCAADPRVLPLGTRIRVLDAGRYSGEYVVSDTGRTINGHEIDIYVANDAAAKRFGRKKVRVQVLGKKG